MLRVLLYLAMALCVHWANAVTFLVTTNGDSGPGSLRQAILDANATPGPDAIHFGIGTGPQSIRIGPFQLPTITDTVEIDGTTQPGFSNSPVIEIVGGPGIPRGLDFISEANVVRSLAIHSFSSTKLHFQNGGRNLVVGSYLGVNLSGGFVTHSGASGIALQSSSGNQIGLPGFGNVLSGNGAWGLLVSGHSNVIEGNLIGIDPSGTVARQNQRDGILVGGSWNTISGNLISGNRTNGISLRAPFNVVEGNLIGCDSTGTVPVPNRVCGINITDSSDITLGGGTPAARNIISGNGAHGIEITGTGSSNVVIQGNYIGTDSAGVAFLANSGSGVFVRQSAGILIGGSEPGLGNVISANAAHGVLLSLTTQSAIQGNLIGLAHSGTTILRNGGAGVLLSDSSENLIGGAGSGTRNVVSGNQIAGIQLTGAATTGNSIEGNFIGTTLSGDAAAPNSDGILLQNAPDNTVRSNLLSGNLVAGLQITSSSNVVVGNFIGLDASGSKAVPNGSGIFVAMQGNTIGGTESHLRNVISGNHGDGVKFLNLGVSDNVIQGNYIGLNATGTAPIGNHGFGIVCEARDTTIGGSESGARNVVSGNHAGGVSFALSAATNALHGNFIGTDRSAQFSVPNLGPGVLLSGSASYNFIGGTLPGEANLIAFNASDGVLVESNAMGNLIQANSIHSNSKLGINLKRIGEANGSVTANDVGDADTGPNNLQNFPVITNVVYLTSSTIIQGYLRSSTNGSFSIDVYANVATEQSGYGEGQFYLGNVDVDTDENGFTQFAFSAGNTYSNQFFTATALNYDTADTSEFSEAMGGIRITAIERIASQYRVSFSTITNRTYVLQRASNLNSSMSWSPVVLPPQPIQGTGGIVAVSDTAPSTDRMRIYRVFQQP